MRRSSSPTRTTRRAARAASGRCARCCTAARTIRSTPTTRSSPLDNLDDILSVEGLDAIYIGPSDLSLSLGCRPVLDEVDPKAQQAIDHVLERAKAHGIVAGIHNAGCESALQRIAKGFQFVTVSSDARLI